jgi:hypothetical protein
MQTRTQRVVERALTAFVSVVIAWCGVVLAIKTLANTVLDQIAPRDTREKGTKDSC